MVVVVVVHNAQGLLSLRIMLGQLSRWHVFRQVAVSCARRAHQILHRKMPDMWYWYDVELLKNKFVWHILNS